MHENASIVNINRISSFDRTFWTQFSTCKKHILVWFGRFIHFVWQMMGKSFVSFSSSQMNVVSLCIFCKTNWLNITLSLFVAGPIEELHLLTYHLPLICLSALKGWQLQAERFLLIIGPDSNLLLICSTVCRCCSHCHSQIHLRRLQLWPAYPDTQAFVTGWVRMNKH